MPTCSHCAAQDDFGYGEPGYNGGPASTPHLDAMSRSDGAIQWNRFYCGGAVCSPTRASHLTGRTPNRVCMWDWINLNVHMHLPHNEFTIADAAAKTGHHRSMHVGKVGAHAPCRCPLPSALSLLPSAPKIYRRKLRTELSCRSQWHLGHFAHHPADPTEGPRNDSFISTTPAHVGFDCFSASSEFP